LRGASDIRQLVGPKGCCRIPMKDALIWLVIYQTDGSYLTCFTVVAFSSPPSQRCCCCLVKASYDKGQLDLSIRPLSYTKTTLLSSRTLYIVGISGHIQCNIDDVHSSQLMCIMCSHHLRRPPCTTIVRSYPSARRRKRQMLYNCCIPVPAMG
jgi:hypothetical protein